MTNNPRRTRHHPARRVWRAALAIGAPVIIILVFGVAAILVQL